MYNLCLFCLFFGREHLQTNRLMDLKFSGIHGEHADMLALSYCMFDWSSLTIVTEIILDYHKIVNIY